MAYTQCMCSYLLEMVLCNSSLCYFHLFPRANEWIKYGFYIMERYCGCVICVHLKRGVLYTSLEWSSRSTRKTNTKAICLDGYQLVHCDWSQWNVSMYLGNFLESHFFSHDTSNLESIQRQWFCKYRREVEIIKA